MANKEEPWHGLWAHVLYKKYFHVWATTFSFSLLLLLPYCSNLLPGSLEHHHRPNCSSGVKHGPQTLPNLLSTRQIAESTTERQLLKRLWAYEPLLPASALRRGLAYYGGAARLRNVADKLVQGDPVTIVTLGGSVTYGSGALYGGTYPSRLQLWLDSVFLPITNRNASAANIPHATPPGAASSSGGSAGAEQPARDGSAKPANPRRVRVINSGLPATPSSLFSVCVNKFVPQDADLVVVEFAINDTPFPAHAFDPMAPLPDRLAFEQLLRKLLQFPNRPAVVLLMHWSWFYWPEPPRPHNLFYRTAENDLTVFAQYYDLPVLSLRAAAFPLFVQNAPGFQVHSYRKGHERKTREDDLFYYDEAHPQDRTGYRVLSDLLVSLIRVSISDVLVRPLDEEDRKQLQEPLLMPMIWNNYESSASVCVTQKELEGMAMKSEGFSFQPENPEEKAAAKQKWGWAGRRPGAWVVFKVNTANTAQEQVGAKKSWLPWQWGRQQRESEVLLSYLRSWREDMGVAKVECIAHCRCSATTFDGHWEQRSSQAQLHRFAVTQHEECHIRVSIEPSSTPESSIQVRDGANSADGNDVSGSAGGGREGGAKKGHKVHLMGIMVETVAGTQKHLPVDVFV